MDREMLLQRRAEIEQQFDRQSKAYAETGDELKRLQGEYRMVNELLSGMPESINKPKRIRKATVEADAKT